MVASGDNPNLTSRARHTTELHITDAILDADLSPLAKLLPSLISRAGGTLSYTDVERALPTTRPAIRPALRELEEAGLVTIEHPTVRQKRSPRYERPNHYRLADEANPRRQRSRRTFFTRLPITDDMGRSAGRWILRAVYLREQFWSGAVQIPDPTAARLAGMTVRAVEITRSRWLDSGALRLIAPRQRNVPPTLILTAGPYPADLERFAPAKRKLRTVEGTTATLTVWGTRREAYALQVRLTELGPDADQAIETMRQSYGEPAAASIVLGDGNRQDAGIPGPLKSVPGEPRPDVEEPATPGEHDDAIPAADFLADVTREAA